MIGVFTATVFQYNPQTVNSAIQNDVGAAVVNSELPWYRQVSGDQWRAFWAVFLGWIVDAFDFNILTFILIDMKRAFPSTELWQACLGP